ncbi:hypothetical protein KIS4809_1809 [Bacillus sp. ZZV12-4809]|nr:hypothetical protein KIS4809_1809 [Bacillus sp. ZZV12-4809]
MPKTESIFKGNARETSPPELASGPLKSYGFTKRATSAFRCKDVPASAVIPMK